MANQIRKLTSRVHFVVNRGPNTLGNQMISTLERAKHADIAVAFASSQGVQKVLPALRRVAKRGGVRIIVGLYRDVTKPAALRKLFQVDQETKHRFSARISRNRKFHSKLYLFTSGPAVVVFIGSSNLSIEGMSSDGELVAFLSLPKSSGPGHQIVDEFEKMWAQSAPLSRGLIKRYTDRYDRLPRPGKLKGLPTFAEILGKQEPKGDQHSGRRPRKCWREPITAFVQPATERIIRDVTDWERKRWTWYCSQDNRFRDGDWTLMLDFTYESACLLEVKDRIDSRTPDGRHFVAFRRCLWFQDAKNDACILD